MTVIKFLVKAVATGVVVYGVTEALHRFNVAGKVIGLSQAVVDRVLKDGIFPKPAPRSTPESEPIGVGLFGDDQ